MLYSSRLSSSSRRNFSTTCIASFQPTPIGRMAAATQYVNGGAGDASRAHENGVKNGHRHTRGKTLTLDTMNANIKVMEYAVRGPLVIRAGEIETELKKVRKIEEFCWRAVRDVRQCLIDWLIDWLVVCFILDGFAFDRLI